MKRTGALIMPFISFFLVAFVTVYMGYHVIAALQNPLKTIEAITFVIEDTIPANGYFVRNEVLIPRQDGIVQPAVDNGERLAKGDTAFNIYQNQAAINLSDELSEISRRIADMEYAEEHSAASVDVSQLDKQIYASVTDMLNSRDNGDRQTALTQSLEFKSLAFRREYTYGKGEDLSGKLEQLKIEEEMLRSAQQTAVSGIKAEQSGAFTTEVDGYENVFNMESLETVTLIQLQHPAKDASLTQDYMGKQVVGFSWGYIIAISEEDARFLKVGQKLTLRFTDIGRTVVDFKIARIHFEEGEAVISLTTNANVVSFINTRRLPSDVLLNSYSGLRVPKEAMRMVDGQHGVYCLMGSRAVFKPVEIVTERDNFYLVEFDPVTAKPSQLLPADRMILAAKDIYDGKVFAEN